MAQDIFSSPMIFLLVLMFLLALLFAFGSNWSLTGGKTQQQVLLSADVGTVGGKATSFRHVNFPGFTVSHAESKKMLFSEPGPFKIVRGAITQKEHQIRFNLEQEEIPFVENGRLSFHIIETNSYGALQILLNGQLIWSEYPEQGDTSIDMAPFGALFKSGENTIVIRCTSSGWRLWAPAEYNIEAFTLLEEARSLDQKSIDLMLSGAEASSTSLVRTIFTVIEADTSGELAMKVNDIQFWQGKPGVNTYNAEFQGTSLHSGRNTLVFQALPGGRYTISRVEVILSYGGIQAFEFNVTTDQLKALREGTAECGIEMEVIEGDKNLTITVVGETEKILYSGSLDTGTKKFTLLDTDIVAGRNTMSLSSDGIYNIGGLRVILWPK